MVLKIELGISNQVDVVYMWCPNWHVSEMWNEKIYVGLNCGH
jgi:hypothetical protein